HRLAQVRLVLLDRGLEVRIVALHAVHLTRRNGDAVEQARAREPEVARGIVGRDRALVGEVDAHAAPVPRRGRGGERPGGRPGRGGGRRGRGRAAPGGGPPERLGRARPRGPRGARGGGAMPPRGAGGGAPGGGGTTPGLRCVPGGRPPRPPIAPHPLVAALR